jgi:O-antigen/teichoic acid export membrane protein
MVLLTLPATVGLALVARPLSELLVGPAMADGAAHVTPWIAAGGFFSGITTYYLHQAFTLGRRTGLLLLAMTFPAGLNLALNLVLVPRFGIDGAMWATAASYAAGALASWGLGRRVIDLPLPLDTLLKAGLACVPMALVVSSLPALGGIAELAMKAGAGALLFGGGAWMLDAGGLRTHTASLIGVLRPKAAA